MIQLKFIFISLAVLLATNAWTLPDDDTQTMFIDADTHEFDIRAGTTTFLGNVVLQQGSLKINANKVVYYGKFEKGKVDSAKKIVATGNPARFQQTPKENSPPVTAVANTLEYSASNETLFLIENASLDQDGTSLSGNRIEYDVKKALVKAGGKTSADGTKERVRMVIPPKTLESINGEEGQEDNSSIESEPEEDIIDSDSNEEESNETVDTEENETSSPPLEDTE